MDTSFNALSSLQPGLNPWLVVLLSAIAGLLAFALSNALYVLHMRHRRVTTKLTSPLAMRARHTITAALFTVSLVALGLIVPGPTLVEGRGWLSGDNLFSVTSRAGFVASYPNLDREVRQGDPILQLMRDAGPEEIAEAATRRTLLAQDLEFMRLEILRVDPLLLSAQATEKDQLDDLLERRRVLVESQESLVRGTRRQKLTDQSQLDEVGRDLQAARHELDQIDSSCKAASAAFDVASRPEVGGLFSKDEVVRREERMSVLRSRREELRERVALLAAEQKRQRALTQASDETQAEHLATRGTELQTIDAEIVAARERVRLAWQAIEHDRARAGRQREYRIRQIELQIAELDHLLNARKGALEVRAPWNGLIGFREPSPASARSGNRPLLVLYKPGSISVRIHVATDLAPLQSARGLGISMQALVPEASSSIFAGRIVQFIHLPNGNGELQIAGEPPDAAIRELATGNSVPVHVIVRRLNPLAAAGIGWGWWLAGALLAALLLSEGRLWWSRRHAHPTAGEDQDTPRPGGLRLDWGGNPDEFLEYVAGVGIVPRKLRRPVSAVEGTDEDAFATSKR